MGAYCDVTGNSAHHNEASSIMARTKRTLKSKPSSSKLPKHSANSSVDSARHHANDSATDADSIYVEENPIPDIPSPLVTLTDIGVHKQTTKLSRHDTPSIRPTRKHQEDSDDISVVDTPTTPVTPYEPQASSREVGAAKQRNAVRHMCSQMNKRGNSVNGTSCTPSSTTRPTPTTKTLRRKATCLRNEACQWTHNAHVSRLTFRKNNIDDVFFLLLSCHSCPCLLPCMYYIQTLAMVIKVVKLSIHCC